MNNEETVSCNALPGKVIDICAIGGMRQERTEKQQKRIRTADDRFAALDERSQRYILYHTIGYIEASNHLIASGKRARSNGVSRIFQTMEETINELWNGRPL